MDFKFAVEFLDDAKNFIDRSVCGWEIPTEWFQSINPFLILIFGLPVSALWIYLTKKGKNPSMFINDIKSEMEN